MKRGGRAAPRKTLIFVREGARGPELCVDGEVYPITPEKALDLAVELLKLAAPIMRAKAYGVGTDLSKTLQYEE